MYLTLWYIAFVCHQNYVCEKSNGSVYVGGYCGLSQNALVSLVNCAQSAFLQFVNVRGFCCGL